MNISSLKNVYLVLHRYRIRGKLHTKQIGIFSTETKAIEAIAKCQQQEGFKDSPLSFTIEKLELGKVIDCGKGVRI